MKYGGDSRSIELRLERRNGHVRFSVADRGIGIPSEEQARIFDRFYRVNDDRVHASPGTGLGLAIAREIVSAHRGEIGVQSAPGQGSTFTIALPTFERSAACPSS